MKDLHDSRRFFLIRVGKKTTLLRELGYEIERKNRDVLWLWPNGQRTSRPFVVRLIRLGEGQKAVFLITNHLDPENLSDQDAGVLYKMRWGVEVFYRQSKQTLETARSPARRRLWRCWRWSGRWWGCCCQACWRRASGSARARTRWR